MMIAKSNDILFGFTEWVKAPQGYFLRGALQHAYAYMDVGGRATQEQLPSSPVCLPGHVKSSLLRVLRSRYLCVHARQLTKGAGAINSLFHYASHANTTAWTQDDSRDGGGREGLEHILEVERIRTNIGHIRVK